MTVRKLGCNHHRVQGPGAGGHRLPIAPFEYGGLSYSFGQANNALLSPGLGLGTIVAGAAQVTDGMVLVAAADAP